MTDFDTERYYYIIADNIAFIFMGFAALILFLWPCVCSSTQRKMETKVIGLARSRPKIQISEIARALKLPSVTVKEMLYDAISSGNLSGRMDGDIFIRCIDDVGTAHAGAKVLVICPFCRAKTEQGLPKCQNYRADL
ncbi:MAG: PCI domain-containing protein [Candidatus Thorarchaeota archaeon]